VAPWAVNASPVDVDRVIWGIPPNLRTLIRTLP
jgi:hypothetical protein